MADSRPEAQFAIRAEGLEKSFGGQAALKGISLAVPSGSVYCIAGPNGSGKTTLLELLSGSIEGTGKIEKNGRIGYARQNPLLYWDLTVSQNMALFSEMLGSDKGGLKNAEALGLAGLSGKKAGELSTGMKKRLELAIALLTDPDILLLDEPTTGLDKESSEALLSFIRNIKGKKTLVLASHQLSDLEGIGTHLLVLKSGSAVSEGPVRGGLGKAYLAALGAPKAKRQAPYRDI